VKSSYGHTYVAEEFNYDPHQKKIRIVFQWVHLSIINFLTNYELSRTLRVITKTYAEQKNKYIYGNNGCTDNKEGHGNC